MSKWMHLEYAISASDSGRTFAVYDVGFYASSGRVVRVKLHGRFKSFDATEEWLLKNIQQ